MLKYLKGKEIPKENLKDFLNKRVIYLPTRDIDRSGRGYFFPRMGTITTLSRYNIDFDNDMEFHSISEVREFVEATEESILENF